MEELIKKTEMQSKTLFEVMQSPDTNLVDLQKAMACRRFVMGFLRDLKKIQC